MIGEKELTMLRARAVMLTTPGQAQGWLESCGIEVPALYQAGDDAAEVNEWMNEMTNDPKGSVVALWVSAFVVGFLAARELDAQQLEEGGESGSG